VRAAQAGLLRSAHDLSEGGLGVALAEACVAGRLGARCTLSPQLFGGRADVALFGEGPSRVVVSVPPERYEAFAELRGSRSACWEPWGKASCACAWQTES
ncbi:MAG: hypothetical protein C4303_08020, partial [candidate division GAL15 bacterium]